LRPAVVHTRNLSGLDALLPARLAGVAQCVHGEHGWDVGNLQGDNRRLALLRRAHRPLVDRYVTVSKDLQNYLIARVGVAPARITQIYNGVDTDRFSPRNGKPPRILPEDFVAPGRLVIGTVGRIEAVKNHSTLVRAFANLVRARSDVAPRLRLAIVGAGPLLNDLRTLVKTLGVEPLVWLPGARDDVPDVLRALDVFVLPSLAEGVSNTILEAMASGLPILAGAVGGNVEIVEDGRFGRLFAPQEPNSLMHLMSTYADDDSLREQHAREARHVAVARFDLVTMVDRYQDIYETMCQSYRECAA
jgi:sugar transferase (PEP-CTERM/EpsH1 system associated)